MGIDARGRFVHPERWRETCDPFKLKFNSFKLIEVLGYPHAGNDVFHVRGEISGETVRAYVKVERQRGAAIGNEIAAIKQISCLPVPEVLDYSLEAPVFAVTRECAGNRLSVILGENEGMESKNYMHAYGEALGLIHSLTNIKADGVADRKFFHTPTAEMLDGVGLSYLADYFKNKPSGGKRVFCHGDFHYANVLWENGRISGVLDLELSGYGNRDFDIAWAIFLRPGQKFLRTEEERQLFFEGYRKHGQIDLTAVNYYTAQIYAYFLEFNKDNAEYNAFVRNWLKENCK